MKDVRVATIKGEPAVLSTDVDQVCAELITAKNNLYWGNREKDFQTNWSGAEEIMIEARKKFSFANDKFMEIVKKVEEDSKKASGAVRRSADDLASGLARIEKQANFANLERYVVLLERAAAALQSLAELERLGKLEKIAGALK